MTTTYSWRIIRILPEFRLVVRLVWAAFAVIWAIPQASAAGDPSLAPISLNAQIEQTTLPAPFTAGGAVPLMLSGASNSFDRGFRFRLFQMLPARMWFNATAEMSQRTDSNVFMSRENARSGYVVRLLPNITVGYDIFKNTAVYANCFSSKDTYFGHPSLNFPAMQAASVGVRQHLG
jgi:hypothetical protein